MRMPDRGDAAGGRPASSSMASYSAWNRAVVDVVFTEGQVGRPVYLDMDDDVLLDIAKHVGGELEDPAAGLAAAVRSTLSLGAWERVFDWHLGSLAAWRRRLRARRPGEELAAPQVIALLALLTLAAERMGEDASHAPNAYYPRLFDLLGISDERSQDRFASAYRRSAESMWGALNEWLEALDGARGTPTAFALSFRYVGLALSQALVRATDRARFPSMFRAYALAPGAEIAPADMARLLDGWISQEHCPISNALRAAWDKGQARERIATVAALELEAWDGTSDDAAEPGAVSHDVRLLASMRTFPATSLELSLSASIAGSAPQATLTVASAVGAKPTIDLVRGPDGWLRARVLTGIDSGSLLSGLLKLEDPGSGLTLTRRPRPLIPLARDELQGTFAETERVQLGGDCMLLATDDKGLADKVERELERLARPGFQRINRLNGLPDGWVLFRDVQVMAVAGADLGAVLNPLVPIASSQLSLAGGLKLPGRIRKFSAMRPPEIRAITQNADTVAVTLTNATPDGGLPERRWESKTAALVVPLEDVGLPDGDYLIRLFEGAGTDPRQQATLRLRSSDTVDAYMWESSARLVYDLEDPAGRGMLSATELRNDCTAFIDGALAGGVPAASPRRPASEPWWVGPRPAAAARAAPAVVAQPDPSSCVVTGAHHIELPTYYGTRDKRSSNHVSGVCKHCGLVKRYPAWAPRPAGRAAKAVQLSLDVGQLPAVHSGEAGWDAALDGLMHVGGGTASSLERLASQVEESGLFLDAFLRGLIALGHIQVEYGSGLQPSRWEISPSCVAEAADGSFFLVGYWPQSLRNALSAELAARGGSLRRETQHTAGPSVWRIRRITPREMAEAAAALDAHSLVRMVPDAARTMAATLAPLSRVRGALELIPLPGARKFERFHLPSASWTEVSGVGSTGAYRLTASFRTIYLHVSPQEARDGAGRLGNAQLVKHLAALDGGKPLVSYDEGSALLSVALGADLPGMYGRAASLCSGELPVPVPSSRVSVYRQVPPDIASTINGLMSE